MDVDTTDGDTKSASGGGGGTQHLHRGIDVGVDTMEDDLMPCRQISASKHTSSESVVEFEALNGANAKADTMKEKMVLCVATDASEHQLVEKLVNVDVSGVSKRVGVGGEPPNDDGQANRNNEPTRTLQQLFASECDIEETIGDMQLLQLAGERPRCSVNEVKNLCEVGSVIGDSSVNEGFLLKKLCNEELYSGMGLDEIRLDDRVGSSLQARVVVPSSDDCCIASKILERTELSQSSCVEKDDRVGSGLHARVVV